MKNEIMLSTTTRLINPENNLDYFKDFFDMLKESKFKNANLNFTEIKESLDSDDYEIRFKETIKLCDKYKIKVNTTHAVMFYPFFFNEYHQKEDMQLIEERILKSIKLSSEIKAKWIVLHIGTYLDKNGDYDLKKSVEKNIEYLNKFVDFANENNIGIAIENGTNMAKQNTPKIQELIEIVDAFNNKYKKEVIGICLDFGHANVDKLDIGKEIKNMNKRLKVTHIHDNYGQDDHKVPFDGQIKWKSAMQALKEIHYDGELTSEVRYCNEELTIDGINTLNKTYDILEKLKQYME